MKKSYLILLILAFSITIASMIIQGVWNIAMIVYYSIGSTDVLGVLSFISILVLCVAITSLSVVAIVLLSIKKEKDKKAIMLLLILIITAIMVINLVAYVIKKETVIFLFLDVPLLATYGTFIVLIGLEWFNNKNIIKINDEPISI